jgi:hypothetical protein
MISWRGIMILTRELSLPGRITRLCCTIRDIVSKRLLPIESPGNVSITDKCGNEVASLEPSIFKDGRLFVEWDLPFDLNPGIYTEKWTNIVLQDGRTLDKTHKIFVSNDPYCFEQIPIPDFDVSINKITLYKPTIEPVIFTLNNPEFIIFPKTEGRLFRDTVTSTALPVIVREGGPGLREPVAFINAFDEPVLVVDQLTSAATDFFELTSWEDKAYFLIDTTDMLKATYRIQLKIFLGEFEYVIKQFTFELKDI